MELNLLKLVCQQPHINIADARIILKQYIFHKTGIIINHVEIAKINDVRRFEECITIACNYFLNI